MKYLSIKQDKKLTHISDHSKSGRIRKKALKRLIQQSIYGTYRLYGSNQTQTK